MKFSRDCFSTGFVFFSQITPWNMFYRFFSLHPFGVVHVILRGDNRAVIIIVNSFLFNLKRDLGLGQTRYFT